MAKDARVPQPRKKSEFELRFASSHASSGWRDLCAVQRNAMAEAWDFLTRTPTAHTPTNHPLRDELSTVLRDGIAHQQWQHEVHGGARIWYYVDDGIDQLVKVHTSHPNETK